MQQNQMFFPTNPVTGQSPDPHSPATPSVHSPGQTAGQSSPHVIQPSDVPMHEVSATHRENHFPGQAVDSAVGAMVAEKDLKERLSALQDLASDIAPNKTPDPVMRTSSTSHSPQQPDESTFHQYSPEPPVDTQLPQAFVSQQQNDTKFPSPLGQVLVQPQQLATSQMNVQSAAPVFVQSLLHSAVAQPAFSQSCSQSKADDSIFVQDVTAQPKKETQSQLSLSDHTEPEFPAAKQQPQQQQQQMFEQLQHQLQQAAQPQQQTFQLQNALPPQPQQSVFVGLDVDSVSQSGMSQSGMHQVRSMPVQSSVAQPTFSHPTSPLDSLKQPAFTQPTSEVEIAQPFAVSNAQTQIAMMTLPGDQQLIFQQHLCAPSQDVHMLQQCALKAEPQAATTVPSMQFIQTATKPEPTGIRHLILSDASVTNLFSQIGSNAGDSRLQVSKAVTTPVTPPQVR
ncbi:hypothetical protein NP493_1277g00065 [Ridgeia piscesae]|uniref:Uncharacterized protein n=1 Tax=Ridgeia piscesae TaxID=27915 RepID=A0AAD9K9T8_RIDPI|nr:hypothetical protein NP493_1277g00065 [Ridgeia piscesae]